MPIVGKKIIKEFGDPPTRVLHDIDLKIDDGEFISISGRSGSGKSTLLYIISTLDNPTQGIITLDGKSPADMDEDELHMFRNKNVGFIFQFHYLLPELNALENILLGPRNLGLEGEKKERALELLDYLEIADQAYKFPSQMSGGQQQRVAIARSLILNPKYLFADEPTGNLDSITGKKVMEIIERVNREQKTTVVLVTHEEDYAARADREIYLVDGRVESRD